MAIIAAAADGHHLNLLHDDIMVVPRGIVSNFKLISHQYDSIGIDIHLRYGRVA